MKEFVRFKLLNSFWMRVFLLCALFYGCSLKGGNLPESYLDTPEQHALNGFKFISKQRVLDAQREFKESLATNPEYSPAYRGLALAYGMKGEFQAAYDSFDKAMRYAKSPEEKALAHVAMMRLLAMKREGAWLAQVEKHSASALALVKDLPDAYYYLGLAYNYAYKFEDSKRVLEKVVAINKPLSAEAKKQLELAREIRRAKPGSAFGKRVVFLPRITRAQAAGLLVHELRRDFIFALESSPKKNLPTPTDILRHPLKVEIQRILEWNLRGLQEFGDGTFEPDEYVTRASFASLMADLIGRLDRHAVQVPDYDEKHMPFKDINKNSSYFRDIAVCLAYGRLMRGKHGLFEPKGILSGAQALLIIRKLEKEISSRSKS